MITDCFGAGFFRFGDTETIFVEGTKAIFKFIVPVASLIGWRKYKDAQTPRPGVEKLLGLDHGYELTSLPVESMAGRWFAMRTVFHSVTFVLMFFLGLVLTSER